ncbi:MAG: magnesium transporter [Alphaproteobacteria bacterium]|jgi:magnesium transporter|nr:magnesium transporter [Alphaproteobacteria bacterium]
MDQGSESESRDGRLRAETRAAGDLPFDNPEALQERIETLLTENAEEDVVALLATLHSADLANLLARLEPEDRQRTIGLLEPHLQSDPEVLTYLNEEVREEVLALFHPTQLARALTELDSDDAFDLIEDLEEDTRTRVLAALPTLERRWAEEALALPEYSAGRLMQREFLAVPMFWTVGKTIDYLRVAENLPDEFYDIFVIDPMYRPQGDIRISQILRSKRSVRLADLIIEDLHTVPAAMDQEDVARLFRQYGLTSAPVVDDVGRLIGVITVDDVVNVINEEAEDDILKLGGVQEGDLYRDVLETTRARFSWLGVNLLTAILASAVIAIFEGTIEQLVALAVLMPIVASMGGNAGTQALTVAVRAIATKEINDRNARRVVWKEMLVGGLNGLLFAAITGGVAVAWFGNPFLGIVIGLAMVVTLIVAGLSGSVIPLALEKLKIDPAVASGVFLTTVTDVVGFFAFLGLAAWILL